ncbi:CD82 antigen-like [Watersipora subatra]|uniref:CD82 antigen-like n=1 Tax=Watersipora subatra TaxID=2589382 RepID=UPI00355C9BEA
MGCGTNCLKGILVTLNILFWLFGLGLLGVGIWLKVDQSIANFGEAIKIGLNEQIIDIAAYAFIGAGIWTFLVGFFGCWGAIKESQCLLGFYLVSLFFVFAAELGVAVYCGVQFDELSDKIKSSGATWVKEEYDGKSVISKGFNYVQMEICCCGVNNYLDYKDSEFLKDENNQIKEGAYMSYACCKPMDGTDNGVRNVPASAKDQCEAEAIALGQNMNTSVDTTCDSAFRAEGCVDELINWVEDYLPVFIGVAAGVAFVQILIFSVAVCLCVQIRRETKS